MTWPIYVGCGASVAIMVLLYMFWLRPIKAKLEEQRAENIRFREESEKEIQTKAKEIILEAKDEAHRIRAEAERENREKRAEIQRLERRLTQKE